MVSDAEKIDEIGEKYGVSAIEGGRNRNQSIGNALNYISAHFSCGKLILVDAVCPLVRVDLFDQYYRYFDEYDVVFTAGDVMTGLARKNGKSANWRKFFLIEFPDGYRFDRLKKYFNVDFPYTTPLHMLPREANVKFNYDFKDYMKVMYPHDLAVAEALLKERERYIKFETHL